MKKLRIITIILLSILIIPVVSFAVTRPGDNATVGQISAYYKENPGFLTEASVSELRNWKGKFDILINNGMSIGEDYQTAYNAIVEQLKTRLPAGANNPTIGMIEQYYEDSNGDLSKLDNATLKIWNDYLKDRQSILGSTAQAAYNQIKNIAGDKGIASTEIDVDYYRPSGTISNSKVNKMANQIIGAIRVIGSFVAVGSMMVLGIKYMMGSIEEKAEYKKTMIPYFIGIILLFAGVNLVAMIYNVVQNIN